MTRILFSLNTGPVGSGGMYISTLTHPFSATL